MPSGALDHTVRGKFRYLLDASYRYFPFAELPVELVLRILTYATACSQGTYRSLLLINKSMSNLIGTEKMLEGVSVILVSEEQLNAFEAYLEKRPEVIPQIHALWTICPGSVQNIQRLCASIINTCTSIRALACHPTILLESVCRGSSFKHTHCVELTLIEFHVTWSTFMNSSPNGSTFFHQIQRLHFIGALDHSLWATWAVIPKLNNLTRVSIAMGSQKNITQALFAEVVKSPKLKQVVITTRLHGEDQQNLSDTVQEIDHRFSVIHRRRRWKECNLWHEGLQDPDRFWTQANAEKDLPAPPRPAPAANT
ncbi:hypothetical protein C8F04DRAFT_1389332 [Mycena alexandri]|uniref:Uncharacterized protein n=1 Tax=Mycena alexandri TaxID=1745969 RepID=A0AAD6XD17_9AGAR|nr:hypothetical protein C8F04DRAFT_1389332 [Mycena alexandri]